MRKKIESKIKEAIKKDFNILYQKEFTTDWKEQRLVRELEINVMSFPNLLKELEQSCETVLLKTLGEDMTEIPGNIAIYKDQDYAYKAGFNHRGIIARAHLREKLKEIAR